MTDGQSEANEKLIETTKVAANRLRSEAAHERQERYEKNVDMNGDAIVRIWKRLETLERSLRRMEMNIERLSRKGGDDGAA